MEERLGAGRLTARSAARDVEPGFLVCPVCTTKLKQACAGCKSPLEPLWQVCPYCETPVDAPAPVDSTLATRHRAGRPRRPPRAPPAPRSERRARGRRADTRPRQARRHRSAPRRRDPRPLRAARPRRCAPRGSSRSTASSPRSTTPSTSSKPFFGELVDFITSAPTLALVLEGEGAIAVVRTTMGATNPADAAPGTIRGDLALVDAGQPRARLRLARVGGARDRALVPRWPSSEDRAPKPRALGRTSDEYQARHGAFIGQTDPRWGIWQLAEDELRVLGDVGGQGRARARLRRRPVVGPGWRRAGAAGRRRQLGERSSRTRGERMSDAGVEFPLVHARAEDVPLGGRELRRRLLRPRRVRSGATRTLDSRGCAGAPAWRRADLPGERDDLDALRPRGRLQGHRPARPRLLRHAPLGVAGGQLSRLPHRVRGLDPASARERVHGRGSDRDPGAGRCVRVRYSWADKEWASRWPSEEIWKARKL